MPEIGGALMRREFLKECADPFPRGLNGSLLVLPDEELKLGEHHFDGVEIRAVRRQEKQMGADATNSLSGGAALVTAEVVENDDVAWSQGRNQRLLNPGGEADSVDGAVEDQGCYDPVVTETGKEGQCLPMSMRHLGEKRLAPCAPSVLARHVGLYPRLVDEDQTRGIKLSLVGLPASAQPRYLQPILLLGQQRFLNVRSRLRTKRQTVS